MRKLGWILIVLVVGVSISRSIVDPDLWWHLTVGKWITAHNAIPTVDYWNVFSSGSPWIAYSWSVEILFALTQKAGGDHGLLVLYLFLGVLFVGTLAYCYGALSGNYFLGLLIAAVVACSAESHFTLRPQSITWILFALSLFDASAIDNAGLSKKRAGALFVLGCIWANIHISSVFGLAGIFFWIIKRGQVLTAAASALVFFAGTLFTPHFGAEWLTAASKSSHPALFSSIIEFGPATVLHYSTGLLIVLLGVLLSIFHFEPKAAASFKLLFVGIVIFGGLAIVKFLPYGMIALGMLVCCKLGSIGLSRLGNIGEALLRLEKFSKSSVEGNGTYFLLSALLIVRVGTLWQVPVDYDMTPKRAVEFVKENNLSGPYLNGFGEGGFLIYSFSNDRGEPEVKFPIDGRTNVPPKEVLEAFFEAYQGGRGWEKYLELVKPETIIFRSESPFVPILLASGRWCEAFRAGKGMGGFGVYVRENLKKDDKYFCQR